MTLLGAPPWFWGHCQSHTHPLELNKPTDTRAGFSQSRERRALPFPQGFVMNTGNFVPGCHWV